MTPEPGSGTGMKVNSSITNPPFDTPYSIRTIRALETWIHASEGFSSRKAVSTTASDASYATSENEGDGWNGKVDSSAPTRNRTRDVGTEKTT